MPAEHNSEGLKQVIGAGGLAATVVNLTIGAGIFALPGLIGVQLGAASLIGYVLCALMFVAIVLCYVEISGRVHTTGGSYAYVEAAFGPLAGFVVNWLFFFGWSVLADAAAMNIVADSLAGIFPALLHPLFRALLFFVLIAGMAAINIRGTKTGVRFIQAVTVIKLLPLLGMIVFGFAYVDWNNLRMDSIPSLNAFGQAAPILFFAFAGFETSLNVSGEIKDPKRTIPRGLLLGGILVLVIYMSLQAVTQGILGAHLAEVKDAPFASVAEEISGPVGALVLLFAAAVSAVAMVNGDILATSRLLYAGAKDELFPKFLGKVHPRFATPHMALITYSALIFVLSISGGFKQLAVLASGALLVIYLMVILAMIKLRSVKKADTGQAFKIPGGLSVPFVAIAAIVYVLSTLQRKEIVSILIFIAAVCAIYFAKKYWNKISAKKNPLQ